MATQTVPLELPEELVALVGSPQLAAEKAREAPVIELSPLSMPVGARPFGPLGADETEVIGLALELGWSESGLLDDRTARQIAGRRGLQVIGSGGVLVEAKRFGLIATVRPLLAPLLEAGLYLGDAAYGAILASAFEHE